MEEQYKVSQRVIVKEEYRNVSSLRGEYEGTIEQITFVGTSLMYRVSFSNGKSAYFPHNVLEKHAE